MKQEFKELLSRYLDQASIEEKTQFALSYRSLEQFYLDEMIEEYNESMTPIFTDVAIMLEDTVTEVGLEPNESYYPRIGKELMAKHREAAEAQRGVEETVPIGA